MTRTVISFEPQATVTSLDPVLIPIRTVTTTVAMPSATRLAAQPAPEIFLDVPQPKIGRTVEVEILADETLAAPIPVPTAAFYEPEPRMVILDDNVRPIHHYRDEHHEGARPAYRHQEDARSPHRHQEDGSRNVQYVYNDDVRPVQRHRDEDPRPSRKQQDTRDYQNEPEDDYEEYEDDEDDEDVDQPIRAIRRRRVRVPTPPTRKSRW